MKLYVVLDTEFFYSPIHTFIMANSSKEAIDIVIANWASMSIRKKRKYLEAKELDITKRGIIHEITEG